MKPNELILHWGFRADRMQRAHYGAARRFGHLHLALGLPVIMLSTVVATSLFVELRNPPLTQEGANAGKVMHILIGLLSMGAAVLASLQTFLHYSDLAEKHRLVAGRYGSLKHDVELLLALPPGSNEELRRALSGIEQRWAKLGEESPGIPRGIWSRTEKTMTYEMRAEQYPAPA